MPCGDCVDGRRGLPASHAGRVRARVEGGALAGAAVLLLGAACLVAVLRSSPTERVRERNRERVLLRLGVRSDAWDGFSDGMFATDRDGVTLVVQNLRAWTVDILG